MNIGDIVSYYQSTGSDPVDATVTEIDAVTGLAKVRATVEIDSVAVLDDVPSDSRACVFCVPKEPQ